jgi:uncharacterized RDD family membrane protein YckC/tetratricopeptide (TPR) repeat protein
MVFHDLGDFSSLSSNSQVDRPIAPAVDRFMAFVFDAALFSPLTSLLLSPLFKKIELRYYTAPGSLEFIAFLALGFFATLAFAIFLQTLCVFYWGATPGKYFFKLRVISLTPNSNGKVQLIQSFLRSGLWAIEFLCLWIPYIAIFSHRERRPVHDRASETMVVTLKVSADGGPHPLEAHFVRNLFFILIAVALMWTSLFSSQIYHMAAAGEFKKSELEERQALCSEVTHFAEKGMVREDLALARYMAGEVDDDCLLSEADFGLWTQDPTQQAWGYLAKSIYYQYDHEKSNHYLDKVCEQDPKSEACRLSLAITNEDHKELTKEPQSLTAHILQVRELTGKGDYDQALQKLTEVNSWTDGASVADAFQKYTQKQTVKLLWMLGKHEQSSGAYLNSWPFMEPQDQSEISAWMCLEQVEDHCDNVSYKPCEDLRETLTQASPPRVSTEAVVAMVKEAECKKSHDLPLLLLHEALEENSSLNLLVSALSSQSNWSPEHRLDTLRDLSFSKSPTITKSVQKQARLALVSKTQDIQDFVKTSKILETAGRHDWAWQKIKNKIAEATKKDKSSRLPASETGE